MASPTTDDPWLDAIVESTACLRHQDVTTLESCFQYLTRLETILRQSCSRSSSNAVVVSDPQSTTVLPDETPSTPTPDGIPSASVQPSQDDEEEALWSSPPTMMPPPWRPFAHAYSRRVAEAQAAGEAAADGAVPAMVPSSVIGTQRASATHRTTNGGTARPNVIQREEDDDDDAGDVPTLNVSSPLPPITPSSSTAAANRRLDARRLLIRILTFQSEVLAAQAANFRLSQEWRNGASYYQSSLTKIHAALFVADAQLSKWMSLMNNISITISSVKQQHLEEDATIVSVAVQSLTAGRDKFLELAIREEQFLLRKLEPQWQTRDQAKQRMGVERWTNNPAPKLDHVRLRRDLELKLREVRAALQSMHDLETLNTDAQEKSRALLTQLEESGGQGGQTTTQNLRRLTIKQEVNNNNTTGGQGSYSSTTLTPQQQQQRRYNFQRPPPHLLAQRVDLQLYPDPTEYGWKFTGSWEAAEFFETTAEDTNVSSVANSGNSATTTSLVKLDWYFTTATIKTSMDHPVQGKTQMFLHHKDIDPELYKSILQNPRIHTGERYQQRRSNNNNNHRATPRGGGGRGRSGRGSFGRGGGGRNSYPPR